MLTKPQQLVEGQHKSLTQQLLVSSFFLTVQVCFLVQFAPSDWASLPLLGGDVIYRISQLIKIAYYYHRGHRDNRQVAQETNKGPLCKVFQAFDKLKYILELPQRIDFFFTREEKEEGSRIQQETKAPGVWPREGVGGKEEEKEKQEEKVGLWVIPFPNNFGD